MDKYVGALNPERTQRVSENDNVSRSPYGARSSMEEQVHDALEMFGSFCTCVAPQTHSKTPLTFIALDVEKSSLLRIFCHNWGALPRRLFEGCCSSQKTLSDHGALFAKKR